MRAQVGSPKAVPVAAGRLPCLQEVAVSVFCLLLAAWLAGCLAGCWLAGWCLGVAGCLAVGLRVGGAASVSRHAGNTVDLLPQY